MPTSHSAALQSANPHLHTAEDLCPLCEQPIPHEEFDRIIQKDLKRNAELTARLQDQFARQKAQDEAKAKADLDRVKKENEAALDILKKQSLARESAARNEGKQAAEAALNAKLAEAETAKAAAEQAGAALKAELDKTRKDSAAVVEQVKQEALAKEQAAREQGRIAAETVMNEKLAQAEASKSAALQAEADLKAELEKTRTDGAAAIQKIKDDALAKEASIRAEATKAADSAAQTKITAAEEGKKTAEQHVQALQAAHEIALNERLSEQRESLQKAGLKTLQDERAVWFGEKNKLEEKLQDVTRQLQNKTADELGEGAELDLFELLKAEFPDDNITRIAKGTPGADTLHEVFHNGKLCGCIVYESKNSSRWLYDYVTKLRQDQVAAHADHAILSTYKLPSNAKQLHLQDGVIVCQPARVLVLAQILRRHIIHAHTLRLSNEERTQKTGALYDFITSPRCEQFFHDIKTHTETLEDIDVKEVKAHETTWKRRGEVIRKIQRVHGELSADIERIIGTGADVETDPDADELP